MRSARSVRLAVVGLVTLWAASLAACRHDVFCLDCVATEQGPAESDGDRDGGKRTVDGGGFHNPLVRGDGGADAALPGVDGGEPTTCIPREEGELCNHLDDDCDNRIDEDFDLSSDPNHCGACNAPCQAANAEATCEAGACQVGACLDGFADLDAESGCEYRCPVFPPRGEECDAVDDDCDGLADEELAAPPIGLCRTTLGTPCEGVSPTCKAVEGVTTWYCDYPAGVEFDPTVPNGIVREETRCDGHDGDCDGKPDDPWPVGEACDDGGVGECRDVGAMACDPQDDGAVVCDLSVLPDAREPTTELCNNLDDDCDGIIDNGVVDDMVHVAGAGGFYMFRYEASHPDASDSQAGLADHRACSRPDVLPWTYVTFAQAQAACVASGLRLCTGAEWEAACGVTSYPYGDDYAAQSCNGADHDAGPLPTATLPACQSTDGVFDLSGNVKEWTDDAPPMTTDIYVVRGGSHESPELGLTCQTTLSQAAAGAGQATVGFRCCADD